MLKSPEDHVQTLGMLWKMKHHYAESPFTKAVAAVSTNDTLRVRKEPLCSLLPSWL